MTLTSGSGSRRGVTRRLHAVEPDLVPIRVDRARAEHALVTETSAAHRALENQTGVGHPDHPAGLLVDDVIDSAQHAERLAAVRHHLDVEREATITRALVQRSHDLIVRAHSYELARLQIQLCGRSLVAGEPAH